MVIFASPKTVAHSLKLRFVVMTDDHRLIYENNVLKGKLMESATLAQQSQHNSKEQFASSPALTQAILAAVIDALDAHTTLSRQALDSADVRVGLKEVLLGPGRLYEALREMVDG